MKTLLLTLTLLVLVGCGKEQAPVSTFTPPLARGACLYGFSKIPTTDGSCMCVSPTDPTWKTACTLY